MINQMLNEKEKEKENNQLKIHIKNQEKEMEKLKSFSTPLSNENEEFHIESTYKDQFLLDEFKSFQNSMNVSNLEIKLMNRKNKN
jgi:hypothetical protein